MKALHILRPQLQSGDGLALSKSQRGWEVQWVAFPEVPRNGIKPRGSSCCCRGPVPVGGNSSFFMSGLA